MHLIDLNGVILFIAVLFFDSTHSSPLPKDLSKSFLVKLICFGSFEIIWSLLTKE